MNQQQIENHVDQLEKETAEQAAQISDLQSRINHTENENIQLRKIQGQISLVRLLFMVIFVLLLMTGVLLTSSQFIKQGEDKKIELYFNFFERILLVLCGAASTSLASLFRQNPNGNGD